MKRFSVTDAPLTVYGVPEFAKTGKLRRLPDGLIAELGGIFDWLGSRTPGGRVGFRTDAKKLTVSFSMREITPDLGMSIVSCQSAVVLAGPHTDPTFLGLVIPKDYDTPHAERTFDLPGEMTDILIYLPRNHAVTDFHVEVDDGASVLPPTPYRVSKPAVFYGSSITEGAHAMTPVNTYEAILSAALDFDYVCLGFSGNAKGELCIADYINTLDMSIFVYDYDHNADTVADLAATHEPFFLRIREAHPTLPVLMMSRPAERYGEEERARRAVIRSTYERALARGDQNVYFLDGETFYGSAGRFRCSADGIHPNDLGFSRMAEVIRPTLEKIFEPYIGKGDLS